MMNEAGCLHCDRGIAAPCILIDCTECTAADLKLCKQAGKSIIIIKSFIIIIILFKKYTTYTYLVVVVTIIIIMDKTF